MKINIGTPERRIRLILGIIMLVLPFLLKLTGLWLWLSILVGIALIVTGMLRFCPAWSIFGIDTRRNR